MSQEMRFEKFDSHFSKDPSEELEIFIRDVALLESRYLFVRRMKRFQYGYCTHCRSEHMVRSSKTYLHNDIAKCDKCESVVQVKSAGRGRGKMVDNAYVIWYEKSKVNPAAIIATGYKVTKDYKDSMDAVTEIFPVTRYLFEPGKATMMHRDYFTTGIFGTRAIHYRGGWSFSKTVWSNIGKSSYTRSSFQSIDSIKDAIKGTSFQYGDWSKYHKKNEDLIYFFAAFAKYPFIEYLQKMGMDRIADSIVERSEMHHSINYKGKTMNKILGLSKHELKAWKQSGLTMTTLLLRTYKWLRDRGIDVSWEMAGECGGMLNGDYYLKMLEYIQKHAPLERIIRYSTNQRAKEPKRHPSITGVISTWKDYISECLDLQMDVTQEKVLFPNSLYQAHQKTQRSIKLVKDELLNAKIINQQDQLKSYMFESDDLLIRPAISIAELFDEGKALDHCVGRYADKYAEGEIVIMVIRKKSKPYQAFYTLELDRKAGIVRQCRGKGNCIMTELVSKFVATFELAKLNQSKKGVKAG